MISGLWLPGIAISLWLFVVNILWYNLFADKADLEKKRAELNAPILARIKTLEKELANIRCGISPDENDETERKPEREEIQTQEEQSTEHERPA